MNAPLSIKKSFDYQTALTWVIGALIAYGFLWGLGNAPLFDEDEGAFAEATREMLASGNYLTTYVNGVLRFDKPILTYWLQALSMSAFGPTEFAVRLPSALASLGWMYALYAFARRHFSGPVAQIAVLMAACSLQITIIGKAATADALLNCWLALSMFSLYEVLTTTRTRYVYLFYGAVALGWLTKGPVALLIPGVVGLGYVLRWRDGSGLRRLIHLPALTLFVAIALPWYWLEYREQGQAFIDGFFVHHNLDRFQTAFEGHVGSILYYVPVGLLGLMPFTPIVLRVFRYAVALWTSPISFYLLIWFGFVWVFFSFSGTKLPHYLIYGYTPLFVLASLLWHEQKSKKLAAQSIGWFLALLGLLILVPALLPFVIPYVNDPFAVTIMRGVPAQFGWPYFVEMTLLTGSLVLMRFQNISPNNQLVGISAAMLLLINSLWMPRLGRLLQQPVVEAAQLTRQYGNRVVMYSHYWPSFLFYKQGFVERRTPQPGELVLTKESALQKLPSGQVLYQKNGITLIQLL